MVDQILNIYGIDRNQTSIYNPRTNGLTESFNQTMVSALRKQAETQELDWDKWLPFVLLAYRSRVQTSTKYTPYELMFGRKINNLSNWSDNGVNSSSEIIKRAAEIRKLHEISNPEALKNIELAQKVQKKVQNTRNNVKEKTLDVNNKVFVRMPKIQGKLEQIYKGPFKIDGITPNHNYILRNRKNKLLKGSFPLNKLKPISKEVADEIGSDEEDNPEIEKILKSRIKLDKKEYFIKFKDEDKPIWVPENELTSLEEVDEYNNNLGKTTKINSICKINGKSIWSGKWPLIIGIWIALICLGSSSILHGNFSYCKTDNLDPIIQLQNLCEQNLNPIQIIDQKLFTILTKGKYHTYGNGFKCVVNKVTVTTRKGFFGYLYTWRNIVPLILNRVVKTKVQLDYD